MLGISYYFTVLFLQFLLQCFYTSVMERGFINVTYHSRTVIDG